MSDNGTSNTQSYSEQINQLARGFTFSQVLFVANRAGIFKYLEEPRTAEQVAEAVNWHPKSTRMLLDGLSTMDLLDKTENLYVNTTLASACLVPGKPGYQGNIVRHLENTALRWMQLGECMKTGTGVPREKAKRSPEELRNFILGMKDIAQISARRLMEIVDLSGYKHLLDLGGGPAAYGITFLSAFPHMKATLFDFPDVIEIARSEVEAAGLAGRFSYLPGDLTKDEYGTGYDLILLSNIIHSFGPDNNRLLVKKAYQALEPGGMLIVKDFLVDDDRTGPPFGLMFALNMLVGTSEGDTYTSAEVSEWTQEAGFNPGRQLELTGHTRLWLVEKP